MSRFGFFGELHCRWCGKAYKPKKPRDRDGFDIKACKQAHWRAYKKYVTAKPLRQPGPSARKVTQKKAKKRG